MPAADVGGRAAAHQRAVGEQRQPGRVRLARHDHRAGRAQAPRGVGQRAAVRLADHGHLHRPVDQRLGRRPAPSRGSAAAPSRTRVDRAQRVLGRAAVPGRPGQRRVGQQRAGQRARTRRRRVVGGVARAAHQLLGVVGGVVEAALAGRRSARARRRAARRPRAATAASPVAWCSASRPSARSP